MENNFLKDLEKYFKETPQEKILEDWKKSESLDNVEITVDEFLENIKKIKKALSPTKSISAEPTLNLVNMITEEMYKEAQEIIKLYELQLSHFAAIKFLPTLEEGMVLEYRDLAGNWYEYTKDLQNNIHFEPMTTRVRKVNSVV